MLVSKYLSFVIMAIVSASVASVSLSAADKPNIVFVLADDLGWKDVGFSGATFYETPNLDALAAGGMIFERAYAGGPNCMPMRACLISGMYTPRTHMWTPGGLSKGPASKMKLLVPRREKPLGSNVFPSKISLDSSVTSIAEVMKTGGYITARFGKWHMGKDLQGFDVSDANGKGVIGKNFYGNIDVHEWLTDASLKFIEDNKNKPFFLYLSHWDVHTPIRARADVVSRYKKKLSEGDWNRSWNTTYAAMIEAVDQSIGRVQAKLEELKLSKKTLLIFSSDNGGLAPITLMKPLKGAKGALAEGGIRVPTLMSWPGVIKAGSRCDVPITSVDFMPTFAELSGATPPENQPVDGRSILPLIENEKPESLKDRSIFWHYPLYLSGSGDGKVHPIYGTQGGYWRGVPSSVIMKGDWKLMQLFEDNSLQLYNIREDPSESQNLAESKPELSQALLMELKAWQQATKAVIPDRPNPQFDADAPIPGGKSKGKGKRKKSQKEGSKKKSK